MFYLGMDIGQRVDHTALVLVEKLEQMRPYGEPIFEALALRHAERLPLGVPYPMVVNYVKEVLDKPELRGQCALVVDSTGVGAPVVEMLTAARLGCEMTAVTITGGEKESQGQAGWNVPKQDLIAGVQMLLEAGQLWIAKGLPEVQALVKELMDVRAKTRESGRVRMGADGSGQHDDLVIALSLACWKARRTSKKNSFGHQRLF
jgi:hypothetical protein